MKRYFSDDELSLMQAWLRRQHYNAMDIEDYLTYWYDAKKDFLLPLFGDKTILKYDIEITKSVEVIEAEVEKQLTDYGKPADRLLDLLHKCRRAAFNCMGDDNETLAYIIGEIYTAKNLATNTIHHSYTIEETPRHKKFSISEGQKCIRALNNLIKWLHTIKDIPAEYFEELDEIAEQVRLKQSMILNDKMLKGTLCLSIHPMDYMTMSDNGYHWRSCMNWEDFGGYYGGTLEMMQSKYVIVAYLEGEEEWKPLYDHIPWSNKKWRELFIVDEDFITSIKGYPYSNPVLENIIAEKIADLFPVTEFSTAFVQGRESVELPTGGRMFFCTELMYNDTSCGTKTWFATDADIPSNDFYFGTGAHCIVCGDPISCADGLFCEDHDGKVFCAWCGDRINEEYAIYIDGDYYCEDCVSEKFLYDYYTGTYVPNNEVRIANIMLKNPSYMPDYKREENPRDSYWVQIRNSTCAEISEIEFAPETYEMFEPYLVRVNPQLLGCDINKLSTPEGDCADEYTLIDVANLPQRLFRVLLDYTRPSNYWPIPQEAILPEEQRPFEKIKNFCYNIYVRLRETTKTVYLRNLI